MKEDLSPRLKALGSAEMRRNLLKGLQMAAVMEAKRLVPRKTGNLDRSIRRGPINDERALILAGGVGEVARTLSCPCGRRCLRGAGTVAFQGRCARALRQPTSQGGSITRAPALSPI
jgi:hypothetical protein